MTDCEDKKIGVDIIQPRVAHYRLPLYQGLKENSSLDVKVQACIECLGNKSVPDLGPEFDLDHHAFKIIGTPFVWQTGLKLDKACTKGDVLVVCGDLHFISNLPLIIKAHLKGIGVVWWGHHQSANPKPLLVRIRLTIAKWLSDIMLCYTDQGREFLIAKGFLPSAVFSTGNTIDEKSISQAVACWGDNAIELFKQQNGLAGKKVVLFCSVLREKTNLEILLQSMTNLKLKGENFILVIIGDGKMRECYKKLAVEIGIEEQIIWLGAITDQSQLAPWFMSAAVFVYPGAIGLSLLHAFAYGLPVITHNNEDNHGPEFEAFEEGVNGLTFKENDPVDLAQKIKLVLEDESLRTLLSRNAWRQLHEVYTMEKMVDNFSKAIIRCSQLRL